jgi:hypothetical protein
MSFKEFLQEQNKQEEDDKINGAILEFFSTHESPTDKEVHAFAEELGIDEHAFEEKIYKLLAGFFNAGKYNETKPENVDDAQLEKGIKVEMEHTKLPEISRRIALDHLSEIPDYYDRLEKMEKEAGIND